MDFSPHFAGAYSIYIVHPSDVFRRFLFSTFTT